MLLQNLWWRGGCVVERERAWDKVGNRESVRAIHHSAKMCQKMVSVATMPAGIPLYINTSDKVMYSARGQKAFGRQLVMLGTWRVSYALCAATKSEPRATEISPSTSPVPAKILCCPQPKNRVPALTPISRARFSRAGKESRVHGRTRREGVGRACARREGTRCKLGNNVVDSFGFVLDKI